MSTPDLNLGNYLIQRLSYITNAYFTHWKAGLPAPKLSIQIKIYIGKCVHLRSLDAYICISLEIYSGLYFHFSEKDRRIKIPPSFITKPIEFYFLQNYIPIKSTTYV